MSLFSTSCLSQADTLVAISPNFFWCCVSEVVQRVRISSRDFAANLDAAGGAGPVVDAPRVAAGVAAGFAPADDGCAVADCSAGFAPNKVGVGAGAEDVAVPRPVGGAAEDDDGVSVFLPRLPNILGAAAPEGAGAEDVVSSFFPKLPKRLVDGFAEGCVDVVLVVSSFFWPRAPKRLGVDPVDAGAGEVGLPNNPGLADGG